LPWPSFPLSWPSFPLKAITRKQPPIIGLDAPNFFMDPTYGTARGISAPACGLRSKLRKLALGRVAMTYIRVVNLQVVYPFRVVCPRRDMRQMWVALIREA
jgi:hypothetical protein